MKTMQFLGALIGALAASSALAQTLAPPKFEVTSVKQAQPGGQPVLTSNPGRWSCVSCPLYAVLTQAFAAADYQIDAPAWTHTEAFDISAVIPEGARREDLKVMLQKLLQDRFKMTAHRENLEKPVYELVVAPNGPKIKPVTQPVPPPRPGPEADANGYPNVPGGAGMRVLNGRGRIQSPGWSMKVVANYLSGFADRPVFDAAGLDGIYAFTLSFSALRPSPIQSAEGTNTDLGPTIYEAVEQQLGLKLTPVKRPVEVFVIDHLDRTPSEN